MNTLTQQLMELLRCEMWGQDPQPELFSSCQWEQLMQLAKEQTVLGLAVDGKKNLPEELQPDRKMNLRWLGNVMEIQKRNALMNKAAVAISMLYRKMGISPMIMKGQVIAQEYPHPEYRQSGDVDICFHSSEDSAIAYAWAETSTECKCKPQVNEKEQAFNWHGVIFENHERIADMAYGPYQKALQQILNDNLQNGRRRTVMLCDREVETLPLTLSLFHLIIHLEYHILNEGIGLRQFCDLAMFTHNHSPELKADGSQLNQWLKDCGLERIAAVIGWMLHREFGLDKTLIPWNLSAEGMCEEELVEAANMIMNDIWTGGNFGKKKWQFKANSGFFSQKIKALPLHWSQYRKFRHLLPNEAWANFLSKFSRAARGVK